MSSNSTICILVEKIENLIQRKRKLTPDEMEDLNLSMFDFNYTKGWLFDAYTHVYNHHEMSINELNGILTKYKNNKDQYLKQCPDLNDWFIKNSDDLELYKTYLTEYTTSKDQIRKGIDTKDPSVMRSIFDMINDSDETPYYNKPTSVTIRLSHSLDCFEQLHQEQLLALQSN